ncbi:unnamed protein product [Closterium sp. NIES-53]
MAAQELRWLTYLLTDLGEAPRSPPVLYVDNKAMLALCQEHRLEHRTKHIALHYFLARELQQRGQLRLAYVASQANTADVFTKALQPCDHQRFLTVLCGDFVIHPEFALFLLDWSCDLSFSPTLLMGQPFPSPGLTAAAATAVVAVPVRVPVCVHVTVPIAVPVAVPAALPASVPAACAASPSCAATTATAAATAVSYAKAGSFSAAAAAAAAIAAAVAAAALLTGGCALPLHGPSRRVGMGGVLLAAAGVAAGAGAGDAAGAAAGDLRSHTVGLAVGLAALVAVGAADGGAGGDDTGPRMCRCCCCHCCCCHCWRSQGTPPWPC